MVNRYEKMSDEELRELAKGRNKRTGCFKNTAISAQRELWKRHHWGASECGSVDNGYIDRPIEDVQYNG